MSNKNILFSPPDITEEEINAVAEVMRSGWITTGPRTKELESRLKSFTRADGFACFSSATTALESALRLLEIGPGDEVITTAYTYTASASCICHVGATPVLVDTMPGSFEMDYASLGDVITENTKAIIPVDLGGIMCNYAMLESVLDLHRGKWKPTNDLQRQFNRIPIIADSSHALGATWHGNPCGSVADFTAFSFHAVKNFTTAEGGGLAWRKPKSASGSFDNDAIYQTLMLLSLHGQNKDALAKTQAGSWEYDIAFPGWKCNMTDIQAAIGLVQLDRYPSLLAKRKELVVRYEEKLSSLPVSPARHYSSTGESSAHLMLVRLDGKSEAFRNRVIEIMAEENIATNVHYKPLPLMTAYSKMGFDPKDFPNAIAQYQNEITLPLHTKLSLEDVDRIVESLDRAMAKANDEGLGQASLSSGEEKLAAYIKRMDETKGWSGEAAPRAFAVGDEERPVSPEEIMKEMRTRSEA